MSEIYSIKDNKKIDTTMNKLTLDLLELCILRCIKIMENAA